MSGYLLDAHALLWWLQGDPGLRPEAAAAIAEPGHDVFVSAAALWELAIKHRLGRLRLPDGFYARLEAEPFTPLPVLSRHVQATASLPMHHHDPFDRMLVAQALADGLTLITRDREIRKYGVPCLKA